MKKMTHFYREIGEDWFDFQDLYASMVAEARHGAHFVEVGSWKGRSAAFMAVEIFNSGKKIRFDCVDIWRRCADYTELNPLLGEGEDWLYGEFLKNIGPVAKLVNPVRMDSAGASKLYRDSGLDFVFIDAAHDYPNVLRDLKCWYPKIKTGGVIAGHDYGVKPGVKRAVDQFFGGGGVEVSGPCWVLKKRKPQARP